MTLSAGLPRLIPDRSDADLEHWARLLDESPSEIRRAMCHAGPDVGAIRRFLFARQLGLDFDPRPADVAARSAASPSP